MQKKRHQTTIALVYDFDSTLSPHPMQEYTLLPELGIDPQEFWTACTKESKRTCADPILTYMRLLMEKANNNKGLTRSLLQKMGKNIKYFPGVETWFDRINNYVALKTNQKIHLKHYIISAGLKEILSGVSIKKHFSNIYASEYFFQKNNVATFPTTIVNDVSKTQFLFRINKGIEDVNISINNHMPENQRCIPFENIIYIGDGETDVPSMTVTKKNAGYAIAVHNNSEKTIQGCKKLYQDDRINFYAEANYEKNSVLEKRVQLILNVIFSKIALNEELFDPCAS